MGKSELRGNGSESALIPKIIHYCWFGRNPKPKLAEKCIQSWKKLCPDYEIIEWNEDNYDLSSAPLYVRQAYEMKKWAFVTDYIRLHVVHEHGGIYMDTDVELRKPLDGLLKHPAYFGFEDGKNINTGLGFGAEKGNPILKELMDDYADISFAKPDGDYDHTPCPVRNTKIFLRHGLVQNDSYQILPNGVLILPNMYLSPIDFETKFKRITPETISIHWFSGSWQTEEERSASDAYTKKLRREYYLEKIKQPLRALLGEDGFRLLKKLLKRGEEDYADN